MKTIQNKILNKITYPVNTQILQNFLASEPIFWQIYRQIWIPISNQLRTQIKENIKNEDIK